MPVGMSEQLPRIADFQGLCADRAPDKGMLREIEAWERAIDVGGNWSADIRAATLTSELGLPARTRLDPLSVGQAGVRRASPPLLATT